MSLPGLVGAQAALRAKHGSGGRRAETSQKGGESQVLEQVFRRHSLEYLSLLAVTADRYIQSSVSYRVWCVPAVSNICSLLEKYCLF